MTTEDIVGGMDNLHDVILDVFWGHDNLIRLLQDNTDDIKSTESKFYPVACAIINHVLSESTKDNIEHWGFSDTPTRDAMHDDIVENKKLVIQILNKYRR